MPSFITLAGTALLAASAFAAPAEVADVERREDYGNYGSYGTYQNYDPETPATSYCLTDDQAQTIATNYGTLVSQYNEDLANKALSNNFTDFSEGVNSLINTCPQGSLAVTLPLIAPTFSNLTQFEGGQGQQPPINFKQLNIWHSCDAVIIRWETTNTANITSPKVVRGIITMETIAAPAGNEFPYLIDTVYSEFDSAAWLQNLFEQGDICVSAQPTDVALFGTATPVPASVSGAAKTTLVEPTTRPFSTSASTIVGAPVATSTTADAATTTGAGDYIARGLSS